MADIYQAKQGFVANIDGRQHVVHDGDTIEAGHALLDGRGHLFTRLEATHAAPAPQRRPLKAAE